MQLAIFCKTRLINSLFSDCFHGHEKLGTEVLSLGNDMSVETDIRGVSKLLCWEENCTKIETTQCHIIKVSNNFIILKYLINQNVKILLYSRTIIRFHI